MRRHEQGIALLLCILSLMVLTALAVGLMYMTNSETQINANYKDSEQAYFAALGGLQNVRERMSPASTGAHAIGPASTPRPHRSPASPWSRISRSSSGRETLDPDQPLSTYSCAMLQP